MAVYVDDDGNVEKMPSEISDGTITFITNHFSHYAIIGLSGSGDNSNMIVWIALLFVSGAGVSEQRFTVKRGKIAPKVLNLTAAEKQGDRNAKIWGGDGIPFVIALYIFNIFVLAEVLRDI